MTANFSNVLHLLHPLEAVSSEWLAGALNSNLVVVRRTMAGLRNAGLVTSEKGHGGLAPRL